MKILKVSALIVSISFLLTPAAHSASYATRTEGTYTAVLIENIDQASPEFSRICQITLDEVRKWSTIVAPPLSCASNMANLGDLKNDRTKIYGTLVQLTAHDSQLTLAFHSLTLDDTIYPKDVIKGDFAMKDENFKTALRSAVNAYGAFDRNNVAIREYLIQNYVAAELIEAKKAQDKSVVASDVNVEKAEFQKAYLAFNRQNPENKRYVAAGLMSAAVIGVGTINYYREHNPNVQFADDTYSSFGDSMKHRLNFSAWKFDDNTQLTNIGHMYAGTIHYSLARASGLTRWQSLLHTFVLSSMWEYLSEYKQVVSINDQISTTLGGFIIGENFHQMARILQKGDGGRVKQALARVFGSPQRLSQWVENTARGTDTRFDDGYLSSAEQDFWSKMDLYLSAEKRDGSTVGSAGLEAEIVNIPKFDQPGNFSTLLLDDTVQSKFRIEMGRGANISTFKLFAKTTLAAYYKKNLELTKDQKLKGYQFIVGPAMMIDTDIKKVNGNVRDQRTDIHGVIGVIGSTIDMRAMTGDLQVHAVIDVYGDFATVRSLAFTPATDNRYARDEYIPANCDGIQSVMCNYSYYYGIGWTDMAHFDVRYKRLSAGVEAQQTKLSSIEGRSRFGESQRLDAADTISKSNAWVAYDIGRDVRVELGGERRSHVSSYAGKTVTVREAIVRGRLIYKLQ